MSDNDFSTLFIKNIDQCIINYDNIIVMGDLNFDNNKPLVLVYMNFNADVFQCFRL
jgi:hypothetical protein